MRLRDNGLKKAFLRIENYSREQQRLIPSHTGAWRTQDRRRSGPYLHDAVRGVEGITDRGLTEQSELVGHARIP